LELFFEMRKLILLFLLSTSAHADMNDCQKMPNQDEKNYCMASYSGSALFCDRIKGYERRTQCTRIVVQKQRQAQYGIPAPPKEEKKE